MIQWHLLRRHPDDTIQKCPPPPQLLAFTSLLSFELISADISFFCSAVAVVDGIAGYHPPIEAGTQLDPGT